LFRSKKQRQDFSVTPEIRKTSLLAAAQAHEGIWGLQKSGSSQY
jgi:hypothetical protein